MTDFLVWLPGGQEEEIPLPQALAEISGILFDEENNHTHSWEYRAAGLSFEDSWDYDDNPIRGLRQALDKVFPDWQALGLSVELAILICMNLNLILSVGEDDVEQDN